MARKVKPETRAKRMAEPAPESKRDAAYQIALNIVFMEEKLNQTRELIGDTEVVISYDNGGGQSGLRENPAFKGYHALLKSYQAALNQLELLTGHQAEAQAKSSLAEHRANFKALRTA